MRERPVRTSATHRPHSHPRISKRHVPGTLPLWPRCNPLPLLLLQLLGGTAARPPPRRRGAPAAAGPELYLRLQKNHVDFIIVVVVGRCFRPPLTLFPFPAPAFRPLSDKDAVVSFGCGAGTSTSESLSPRFTLLEKVVPRLMIGLGGHLVLLEGLEAETHLSRGNERVPLVY